jgi:hypothetical protein
MRQLFIATVTIAVLLAAPDRAGAADVGHPTVRPLLMARHPPTVRLPAILCQTSMTRNPAIFRHEPTAHLPPMALCHE